MGRAYFGLTYEALMELFAALDGTRCLRLTGLPEGCRVVAVRDDWTRSSLAVEVEAPGVPPALPGEVLMRLDVQIESGPADAALGVLRAENDEMRLVFGDRVQESELARQAVAREREECAAVCDRVQAEANDEWQRTSDPRAGSDGAAEAARLIRARGEPC